jgi:hypothetical protein
MARNGIDPALSDVDRSDNRIRLERGFVEDIPETLRGFDLVIAANVIEPSAESRQIHFVFAVTPNARMEAS